MTVTSSTPLLPNLDEPTVQRYFETLNAGSFDATSQLFAPQGTLYPPFEDGIVGPEAIATYLRKEAEGLVCFPKQAEVESDENGSRTVLVRGKVKMPYFGVNVTWTFVIDGTSHLKSATIRLVASPQELLNLRKFG